MEVRINRELLDEILFDQGISRQRLIALKIKLEEGRGPLTPASNRLCSKEKWRTVGRYLPPDHRRGETILLYSEEIGRTEDESISKNFTHECGHMIVEDGSLGIHPLFLLNFVPAWCDRLLFLGGILSLVCSTVFSLVGIAKTNATELAVRVSPLTFVVGVSLLVFVQTLPGLCYKGYYYSPNEVAAREKAAELLRNPRWEQVISSDS